MYKSSKSKRCAKAVKVIDVQKSKKIFDFIRTEVQKQQNQKMYKSSKSKRCAKAVKLKDVQKQ